eukprot:802322_1
MTRRCSLFSGVFTRENWDNIRNNHPHTTCPHRQRSAIRSHNLVLNMHRHQQHRETPPKNMTWLVDKYPIYFMIAKSGSTSILGYLRRYNRIFGYDKYGGIGHDKPVVDRVTVIQSPCSFTFVRDPVTRFISGYYTINAMLWNALKGHFMNIANVTFLRKELPFEDR